MASGYIAGGALAGIIVAFMAGLSRFDTFNEGIQKWATTHNSFYQGDYADLLSLIPFAILTVLLYLAGRELILAGRKGGVKT